MSDRYRCANGHEWEVREGGPLTCPICNQSVAPPEVSRPAEHFLSPLKSASLAGMFEKNRTQTGTVALGASAANDEATLPPGVAKEGAEPELPRVPGYEILGELGRGGMGVVYKARQVNLNRVVALKMILAGGHAGPADVQRFRAEAEAIARLRHPYIVEVYSVGDQGGRPFFALEYVEGGTLADRINGRPQPAAAAARMIEMLAQGVHAAHQAGIVHRDLKPGNVLLGSDGVPRIADFGLAKKLDEANPKTQTGTILGTPSYMAPEQAGMSRPDCKPGQPAVGPLVDVYALGAILYEMLTGRPPFKAATPLDTVLEVVRIDVVPPRTLQPKVPRDLETICLKCLRKDQAQRYRSAAELAEDLRRYQAGEPILARPAPAWERAWKRWRRRPLRAAAAILLLIVMGVTGWYYAGSLYLLATNRGRLLVTGADSGSRLIVHRGGETMALDLNGERRFTLPAGDYEAELEGDPEGLELLQEQFTVRRNQETQLEVRKEVAREILRLDGHKGPVQALAISPDCRYALSGSGQPSGDRTLLLWDLNTGQKVRQLGKTTTEVLAAAFMPDGIHAVSGGADRALRLWNVQSGEEIRKFEGHKGAVYGVACSPDGGRFLSCSADKTVRLWDRETGKCLLTLEGHTEPVRAVAFSPDGKTAASASADHSVRLWDLATGQERKEFHGWHASPVLCVALSPDGRFVASGGQDHQIWLWDVTTGRVARRLRGHTKPVTGLAFAPDGRQLVSGSADHSVRLWYVAAGKERARLSAHTDGVLAVAFAPDGRHVLTAGGARFEGEWIKGRDFSLRWWSVPRPRAISTPGAVEPPRKFLVLRGHTGEVHPVAFSPDGDFILSGDWDGTMRLWEAEDGEEVRKFERTFDDGKGGKFVALAFTPDGKQVLAGGLDRPLQLWNVDTGKAVMVFPLQFRGFNKMAFSPDGKSVLLASAQQNYMFLWDMKTGHAPRALVSHGAGVQSVAFAPDGKRALTSSDDKTVRLWNVENGKELRRFVGHTRSVSRAVFSLDGKKVLSAGHDGSVRLWDTDSGEELLILTGHEGKVNSVVFTPDGRRAVSVGEDKTVRLWDLETGEEVGRHTGHTAEIVSVAMHPDGTRVVTGSRDQTARVWEIPPVTAIQMARGQVLLDTDTPAVPLVVKRGGRMVRVLRGRSGPATFALQSGEGYVVEPADNVRGLRVSPWEFALAEGATQRIEVRRGPEYVGEIRRYDSKEQGIIQVALSRDGRLALSGGNDNTARLWDVATGKELHKFDAHTNQVYTVGFSPDGKLGLTGGDDHQLLLWDLATCKKIRSFLGHTANVCGAVFSPDGKRIASGSWDRTIRLWDVASGQELKKLTGHTDRIMGVAFSPDGKFLASAGGYDSSVRLWDVESGKEVKKFAGHTGMVRDVKFSSDGKRILSGSADGDGMARLWEVATGQEVWCLGPTTAGIHGVALSPDGRRALLAGNSFQLWDLEIGKPVYTFGKGAPISANSVVFTADGRQVLSGGPGNALHLWQLPEPPVKGKR